MSGENRMTKRRNRIYRRIAVALTVALLAGQSHAFVLAEEGAVSLENGISDEEIVGTDDVGIDGDTDNSGEDNDNGSNDDEEDADMNSGDTSIGEEAESPAELPEEETVLEDGDGLDEPGNDVATGKNSVDIYADEGLNEEYDFVVDNIRYRKISDNEVTVARQDRGVSGTVVIPGSIENAGSIYYVTSIGFQAFGYCSDLTGIKISNGVTNIGGEVFVNCENLSSVEIPDSVTNIGAGTFTSCKSLEHIEIPDKVTIIENALFWDCSGLKSVKIPSGVTRIKDTAFDECTSLSSIETLENVMNMGEYAFRNCSNLGSIRISNGIDLMAGGIFQDCSKLSSLEIIVPSNASETVPQVNWRIFNGLPDDRSITFVAEDGTELTGEAFEKAREAFLMADTSPNDDRWWGWKIKDSSAADDTYKVTINVKKDGQEWGGHGRTFALLANGGSFITDLTQVPNGTYSIYDITGVSEDSLYSKAVDTGMTVTVKDGNTRVKVTVEDKDAEATVPYYTVTFYDGDTAYGDDTLQRPQIVLNG